MSETTSSPVSQNRWAIILGTILREGSLEEQRLSLEFISLQATFPEGEALATMQVIQNLLFNPEPDVRYFAHKAASRLRELHPLLFGEKAEPVPEPDDAGLSPREILLRKIRLGSRYVVFDALERLTESQDPRVVDPLLAYLEEEKDPYKIAYLVKRLGRIPDPRIPGAVAGFLGHQDFRVVANALEGLCDLEVPSLTKRFFELAGSPDHRVRGAAVRALFRYDREGAIGQLKNMLGMNSVAFQDAGLYVLKNVPTAGLQELFDMALGSRFPSIRLKALDIIQEPSAQPEEAASGRAGLSEGKQERELAGALILTGLLMVASAFFSRTGTFHLFAMATLLMSLFFRKSEMDFSRGLGSIALIVSLVWTEVRFLPMLGLLAIWLPLPGKTASEKTRLNRLAVWAFLIVAIAVIHLFRSDTSQALELCLGMMTPERKVDSGLALALSQMQTFRWVVFGALSGYLFLILRLDRWFPATYGQTVDRKRLLMALVAGIVVLLVLVVSHSVGVSLTLRVHGINSPALIFKNLGP